MKWKRVPTKNSKDERGDENFEKEDVLSRHLPCVFKLFFEC
jgi:hypothetical protein